jgi:hypothetical protein
MDAAKDTGLKIKATVGNFFTIDPFTGIVDFQDGQSVATFFAHAVTRCGLQNLPFGQLAQLLNQRLDHPLSPEERQARQALHLDPPDEVEVLLLQPLKTTGRRPSPFNPRND